MVDPASWFFLVLGLLGGFGLSFVFWWVTNHLLVPDLQFSPEISRSKAGFIKSGIRHQIAVKNCGRRDAYNVKYRVRLKITDILQNGGKIPDFVEVAVSSNEFFILGKGAMFRVTPMVSLTEGFERELFSEHIRNKFRDGILTLDDLFEEYKEISIFLEVIGTDRFSGGAKYYRSKEYSKYDVRTGVFIGSNHLSIHKQAKPSSRRDQE
jgi:hypothetical protein